MTKAGIVKAVFHRRPQAWWKLRRITVDRSRSGKYHASILYDCGTKPVQPVIPVPERTLGLKYSAFQFYTADNGAAASPPHWMRQSQEKLCFLQRRLSGMQPGSRNYQETLQKYRLLHEHIANQRKDFIHKESRRIANAWDAVCVRAGDLADLPLTRENIRDAGFGKFREALRYKLARQGKALIEIDRYFPVTKSCSVCGQVQEAVSYRRKTWTCGRCGTLHLREVNAARNIKAQGLEQYFRTEEPRRSAYSQRG